MSCKTDTMTFVQILTTGGYVHDVTPETWSLVQEEVRNHAEWISFEDMYGGEVQMPSSRIDGARMYTPETGKRYRELNEEEESYDE